MIYSLIATAKLNAIDPRASPADVLASIANHPASRLDALLRWHWKATQDHRIKPSPLDHPRSSADITDNGKSPLQDRGSGARANVGWAARPPRVDVTL